MLVVLLLPFFVSAQTTDPIQAEIEALLAEITLLQQQLLTFPTPTPTPAYAPTPPYIAPSTPVLPQTSKAIRCPSLYRDLRQGMNGPDVLDLQEFLDDEGFFFANPTGFFGPTTEASVQAWQTAQGVVRAGMPGTTGFGAVGPRTRAAILNRCVVSANQSPYLPISSAPSSCPIAPPPSTACSVGWQAVTDVYGCTTSYKCSIPLTQYKESTIRCPIVDIPSCSNGTLVSKGTDRNDCSTGYRCSTSSGTRVFSASPNSGRASLTVEFSVGDTTFSAIDFGDGKTEQAPQHTVCTSIPCWTTSHRYTSSGTYTAKLKNGPNHVVAILTITVRSR